MSLVRYNTEHEDRQGTLGSILHSVTFTTNYGMFRTQRISRRWDMHKRITVESAEVAARGRRYKRRNEDIKD